MELIISAACKRSFSKMLHVPSDEANRRFWVRGWNQIIPTQWLKLTYSYLVENKRQFGGLAIYEETRRGGKKPFV